MSSGLAFSAGVQFQVGWCGGGGLSMSTVAQSQGGELPTAGVES